MTSKKDLLHRIKSVKSTQKITKAMKMVAAAKLRRARDRAEHALPYASKMREILQHLASNASFDGKAPDLLVGNGKSDRHLIIVASSDRGLCGSFNSTIVRAARKMAAQLMAENKKVMIFSVGKKGYDQLKHGLAENIVHKIEGITKRPITYDDANSIAQTVMDDFVFDRFDVCHIIYNKFKTAISQVVTTEQLIPLATSDHTGIHDHANLNHVYEYEPDETKILADLLPRNLKVQIYNALLENAASEQGARMAAMDNATNSAGKMIKNLTLIYNRTRQAAITKELIEIISGAEAV